MRKDIAIVIAFSIAAQITTSAADTLRDDPVGYSKDAIDAAAKQAKQRQEATKAFAPRGLTTEEVAAMKGVDPAAVADAYRNSVAAQLPQQNELLILVSESVPVESRKRLARQAAKAGGRLVFRGAKGGLKPGALARFNQMILPLAKEGIDVDIDPNVFRRYDTKVVPAFVISTPTEGCNQADTCVFNAEVIAGDVSLDYALEHLARRDSPLAASAMAMLERMKESK